MTEKPHFLNVPLQDKLIKGLKVGAALQGQTVKATVEAIITRYVKEVAHALAKSKRDVPFGEEPGSIDR